MGRVDETFGEDPMLIGELASAMVKGYQGGAKAGEALPKNAILACAKHFAGYSETQGGRDASEADLSTASSNPGSCRRSSAWPKKVAVRSCWVTSPLKACRSHSTNGC